MRCLYCNKKLSLLKLAKGDSFCSPEHFDAYQLKQSKDAIERLMSVPAEEAPKAPLVAQAVQAPVEESTALARLAGNADPASTKAAEAFEAPPYAPFAMPERSSFTQNLQSPIVNPPEAAQSVEPGGETALPVHSVGETTGMLNLYLRLSLAGKEPMTWTSERRAVVTPEDFNLQIQQPPIGFMPEFQQVAIEEPVEEPVVAEAAPVVEAEPVVEAVPVVEVAPVVEAMPVEEAEPVAEAEPVVAEAAPVVEAVEIEEVALAPVAPAEPAPVKIEQQRVPFLLAPSFAGRKGAPIILHTAQSAKANDLALSPTLERDMLPRLDSCDTIPNSKSVAGNKGFRLVDAQENWIGGAAELPVEPAFIRPDAMAQVCGDAWVPSDLQIVIPPPALETAWKSTEPVDFDLPVPASLLTRPDAELLGEVDPQELLAGSAPLDTASLFLGVLETRPLGEKPLRADIPAFPMKYVWQATMAGFPGQELLPAPWRSRSTYFSLPDPTAAGYKSPMPPLEAHKYALSCIKIEGIGKSELPSPYVAKDFYFPTLWPGTDSGMPAFLSEPGLPIAGSTMLPVVAKVPEGSLKRGKGDPTLKWEPCAPLQPAAALARFLPNRDSAVLPAARNWPRLDAVPT